MPTEIKLTKRPPPATSQMAVIQKHIKKQMDALLKKHVKARKIYMATWEKSRDKAKFSPEIKQTTATTVARVKLSGQPAEQASITVWELLRDGTDVRYMHVTTDWRSKTAPGRMRSTGGRGEKLGLNAPRIGIEARDQDNMINDSLYDDLLIAVELGHLNGFNELERSRR